MNALARGYDEAATFAVLTGCRRMELLGAGMSRVDFFKSSIRRLPQATRRGQSR